MSAPTIQGQVSFIPLEAGKEEHNDFAGCIKPHVVISNQLADSKEVEKKRLQSLGFDVLNITEKGEVTYEVGDLVKVRRGGHATDSWVFGLVEHVIFVHEDIDNDQIPKSKPIHSGHYDIKYEDMSLEKNVYWKMIEYVAESEKPVDSSARLPIKAGDNVQVWSAGQGPWKEATIEVVAPENDCYTVQYTDCTAESDVPFSWIRPFPLKSPSDSYEVGRNVAALNDRRVWTEAIIIQNDAFPMYTIGYISETFEGELSETVLKLDAASAGKLKVGQLFSTISFSIDFTFIVTGNQGENKFSVKRFGEKASKAATFPKISLKAYDIEENVQSARIRSIYSPPSVSSFEIGTKLMTAVVAPNILLVTKIVVADEISQRPKKDPNRYNLRQRTRIVQAAVSR